MCCPPSWTGTSRYFYVYHVVGVMLLIPVFIGFIVETFVTNYAQVEAEFQKEASEVRRGVVGVVVERARHDVPAG